MTCAEFQAMRGCARWVKAEVAASVLHLLQCAACRKLAAERDQRSALAGVPGMTRAEAVQAANELLRDPEASATLEPFFNQLTKRKD